MRRTRLASLALLAPLLGLASTLSAQDRPGDRKGGDEKKGGTLAIVDARVAGHDGLVTVLVVGGKVRGVGSDVRLVRGTPRLDADGARVVPGRIDAWAAVPGADPLGRGLDALDRYDAHAMEEALRGGVTAVFLSPTGGAGVLGAGSVVKLRPGVPVDDLVVSEEGARGAGAPLGQAVVASLGPLDGSPISRVAAWGELRGALENAERYRDALDEYDEALEKWRKDVGAVESRSTTAAVASPTRADAAPVTSPTTPARPGRPEGRRGRRGPPPGGGLEDLFEGLAEDLAEPTEPPTPRPRRGRRSGGRPAPEEAPASAGEEKKDDKKPDRPKQPRPDRLAELLGKVLERELPLRIQAYRAEDIVTALEVQREFDIRIVIVGALEAHRVADALAKNPDVQVVLGDPLPPHDARARPPLLTPGLAAALRARRVPFALGSGDLDATRFLDVIAALSASQGLPADVAEEAITARAAEVLGVGDRLGRVAAGYDGDLVVLEPTAAGPRPRVTVVDGHVVWRRAP